MRSLLVRNGIASQGRMLSGSGSPCRAGSIGSAEEAVAGGAASKETLYFE